MRIAIRHQAKIKEVKGKQFLSRLLKSVSNFTNNCITCERPTEQMLYVRSLDKSLPCLFIPDAEDNNVIHTFIIIRIVYDVYQLSYYQTNKINK